jgi:hypothetical protein
LHGANAGRSVVRWTGARAGFLVFDDASGDVVAHCAAQPGDATDIDASCTALVGYLLQGFVVGVSAADSVGIVFDRLRYLQPMSAPECSVEPAFDEAAREVAVARRYRCLIQPSDDDGDPATPRVWSGRSLVAGVRADAVVCRYTPNATTSVNAEHPETYTRVAMSLDHQNFALVPTGPCPAGTVPHPSATVAVP